MSEKASEEKKTEEIESQSAYPYNPELCDTLPNGEKRSFILTDKDKQFEKFFKEEEQYNFFLSLPLNEAQRVKLITKMQQEYFKNFKT